MSSFTGGPLKLKGQPVGGVHKKKRKQQHKDKELAMREGSEEPQQAGGGGEQGSKDQGQEGGPPDKPKDLHALLHGYVPPRPSDEPEDRRTPAEKRFMEHQVRLEQDRLTKKAAKSHRDRVREFNDYLSKLSEHHDIPRVGPG